MSLRNKIWHIEYNKTITEQKYELLKIKLYVVKYCYNTATIRYPPKLNLPAPRAFLYTWVEGRT